MKPIAHDLFNEIPVSPADIDLWLDLVPNLSHSKFRREAYARAYRVIEKIRAAKMHGAWPPDLLSG